MIHDSPTMIQTEKLIYYVDWSIMNHNDSWSVQFTYSIMYTRTQPEHALNGRGHQLAVVLVHARLYGVVDGPSAIIGQSVDVGRYA